MTIGGDFLDGRERTSQKVDPYYALAVHAIDSDGDLWAWGYNSSYNVAPVKTLGTSSVADWVTTPTRVVVPPGLKW